MSLRVKEIFRTLQGEGRDTGIPCTLVRLSGCNLRCAWCDTASAFQGGKLYRVESLVRRIARLGADLVLVTGGEPLLHPETPALLQELVDRGSRVILETNGSLDISEVPEEVIVVLDIKCPSSGESRKNRWSNLAHLGGEDEIKFVIADARDYRFAKAQIKKRRLERRALVNLSPVAGRLPPEKLAGWIVRDRLPARLNLQLHKLLWPEGEKGFRP
jgi:7-carboxy-7-deazaguanine synthase